MPPDPLALVSIPLWPSAPLLASFAAAAIVGVFASVLRSRRCGICGVAVRRVVYRWRIEGKRKRVCPDCNRTLRRRNVGRVPGR